MSSKSAIKIMLGLIAIVMIFHLCILIKIIPYEITWGGRLQSDSEMYVFEAISIAINLFLFFTLLVKGEYIKPRISQKAVNIILWIFLVIFGLNTIGNVRLTPSTACFCAAMLVIATRGFLIMAR